jgi:hypothetical protein
LIVHLGHAGVSHAQSRMSGQEARPGFGRFSCGVKARDKIFLPSDRNPHTSRALSIVLVVRLIVTSLQI